jgi:hypothetical protein
MVSSHNGFTIKYESDRNVMLFVMNNSCFSILVCTYAFPPYVTISISQLDEFDACFRPVVRTTSRETYFKDRQFCHSLATEAGKLPKKYTDRNRGLEKILV